MKSPSGLLFSNDCSVSILVQIYIFLCFKPVIWKYHGNSSHLNNSHHDCSHHDRCYYDCSHQVTMHDSSHLLLIWPKLIIIIIMALFKRIQKVALPLLNLFNYQAEKKKKLQVLKSRNIKSSRLVCHVMWVYLVFFYLILAVIAFCPTTFSPIL